MTTTPHQPNRFVYTFMMKSVYEPVKKHYTYYNTTVRKWDVLHPTRNIYTVSTL